MMKKLILYTLFLFPTVMLAQELTLAGLLTGIDSSLLANANDVVREELLSYTVLNDAEGILNYKKRVTILNKHSRENYISVRYDPDSKISKLSAAKLDRLGEEVERFKMNDFDDHSSVSDFSIYEDDRVKRLKITSQSYPYTLEYEYTIKAKGMQHVVIPPWIIHGYHQSVESAAYQIDLPAETELHSRQFNFAIEPSITEADGRKVYRWEAKDLPAITEEDHTPATLRILPAVFVASDRFEIDGYQGSMRSWEDYGRFLAKLYAERDQLPAELSQKVKALTAEAGSDREKIDILYRFMQDNMRYVSVQLGIGGWQPFAADYVYKNGYGDCKALSNYMHSMLKEVGIESYPTVINSGQALFEVDETFTFPLFNHLILYIPSEDYWLECTSSNAPPNYLGRSTADQPVLWITPEGGRLARTPALTPDKNLEKHIAVVQLEESGAAKVEFKGDYEGGDHEWWRYAEFSLDSRDRELYLRKQSALPNFTLESLDIKNSRSEPKAEVTYKVNVPRYAAKAGKRLFVPLNPINPRDYIPVLDEDRQHPIAINDGFTEETTIEFHLPEGYKIEGCPVKEEKVESTFGTYEAHTEEKDGKLIYYRKFRIEPTELPASAYEEYRNFFLQVAKLDGAKMILVQQRT